MATQQDNLNKQQSSESQQRKSDSRVNQNTVINSKPYWMNDIQLTKKGVPVGLPSDPNVALGMQTGRLASQRLYGIDSEETRKATQDIVGRRKAALDAKDPASDRLRRGKNAQLRAARASGASDAQMAQIERNAASDIGQAEYRSQEKALNDYQKLIGNLIGNTASLESSYAALEKAGEDIQMPRQSTNSLGTIICTELHRQGYMSDETYEKDAEYGRNVRHNDPYVYVGYIWMARPIVRLMKKSKIFTKLISYPALEWAKDMSGKKSLIGNIINKIGHFICRPVGYLVCSHNKVEV